MVDLMHTCLFAAAAANPSDGLCCDSVMAMVPPGTMSFRLHDSLTGQSSYLPPLIDKNVTVQHISRYLLKNVF